MVSICENESCDEVLASYSVSGARVCAAMLGHVSRFQMMITMNKNVISGITSQALGTRLLSNALYASSSCSDIRTSPLTANRSEERDE